MHINHSVIAHRGASAYAPENTLSAFEKARALGSSWIELDVMLSADGLPFVFHDDSLKRTTNGKGDFGLVDAAYIQSLDAGKWFSKKFAGEKVPLLKELLLWLQDKEINANFEIKPFRNTKIRETTIAVLSNINQYWPMDKPLPLISSFAREALELCLEIAPELPRAMLMHEWEKDWKASASDLQCFSINVNKSLLKAKRITEIKEAGYQLYAYTVNSKRQAKKLLSLGVDAVFSDYADLLAL